MYDMCVLIDMRRQQINGTRFWISALQRSRGRRYLILKWDAWEPPPTLTINSEFISSLRETI